MLLFDVQWFIKNKAMKKFVLIILLFVVGFGNAQTDLTLPNGKQFEVWEDETKYNKTYYVNQNHSKASDSNSGSIDKPFKTIGKAAQLAKPGQRVVIASGTYREFVQPKNGGKSNTQMITFEAEKGANGQTI